MEVITEKSQLKDSLIALLETKQMVHNMPQWLIDKAVQSKKWLNKTHIPNVKDEDWKYSDMEKVLAMFDFHLPDNSSDFTVEISNQNCIHVHNGRVEKVELTPEANNQIIIIPISQAFHDYPELTSKYWGNLINENDNFFSHLNMAFSTTGIFLYVKDNTVVKDPVYMNQDCYDEHETFVQSHNLVVIGKNASVNIIKKQVCSGDGARVFHNLLSEVVLMEGARFSFNRLQNECKDTFQVTNLNASLSKDAQLHVTNIAIGGSFTRNNFQIYLNEKHSHAKLTGLTIINENQHSDSFVNIMHMAEECESDQLFKSIVQDNSVSAFSGKIFVDRSAQKTNAYQSNKNIVLSESANAYSKPQLEIYADDVKCSHGSTTGQIDDEALFYLQARGIKESTARKLLLFAFAENIIERLDDEIFKEHVHNLIHHKFN